MDLNRRDTIAVDYAREAMGRHLLLLRVADLPGAVSIMGEGKAITLRIEGRIITVDGERFVTADHVVVE